MSGALRAECAPLRAEYGALRIECGALRAECGPLRAVNGAQCAECGPLRAECGALRAVNGAHRAECGALRSVCGALRAEWRTVRSVMFCSNFFSGPKYFLLECWSTGVQAHIGV